MFDYRKIDAFFNGDKPFENHQQNDKPQVSLWLRFVKLGFPCVAAAILGVMVVMPNIKNSSELQDLTTIPRKNEMDKLHIEKTVFSSTDKKNRVNFVEADSADEVSPDSAEIKIANPRGTIPTDNGDIKIKSQDGYFNQKTNVLTLKENVNAVKTDGTTVQTTSATYNFNEEFGHGKEKVFAKGNWGTIEAEGFEYLKKEEILVLLGHHIITGKDGVLTAEKETRYYQKEDKTESTGNAVVTKGDNVLRADKIVVYFTAGKNKEIKRVEAYGNVKVNTEKGTASGNRATYNPQTAKVDLYDNVRLEQDGNIINGTHAQTDLKTSISRIVSNKKHGGRISGTFYNKRKSNNDN